jgi:hypothetical protein
LRLSSTPKLVRQVEVNLIVSKLLVFVIEDILVKSLVLLKIFQVSFVVRYDFLLVLDVGCFIETYEIKKVQNDMIRKEGLLSYLTF